MTALPQDNTERWWVIYQVNGETHRLMCRTNDGATSTAVSSAIGGIFSRLSSILNTVTILGLESALRGSNVRIPFSWSGTSTFGAGNADTNDSRSKCLSFVGRSTFGHKSRLFVFGDKTDSGGDYRIAVGTSTEIDNVVAYLNSATGAFLAIDRNQPVWKQYANQGFNDHWIKQHRKGL